MTNLLNGAQVANKLFSTIARLRLLLVMFLTLTISANAWGADYELVTSAPSDWSGEYLIVAGTSALSGGTSSWGTYATVKVTNNKISTTDNISVTISKGGTSGTYYIYMNSNSKYLQEVTGNTFATADAGSTDTEWKISLNQGNAQIACASATTRYLRLNGTSGYRCYTSATGTLPKLYKKVTAASSYTVTLDAGPGTCAASVTEASAGAGVTLPTPTLDCGDWEFAGWKTTSAVTTETTTEPTLIPAGNYKPSNNITLYAVYQRTEGGGGGGSVETTKVFSGANNADLKFTTGSSSNHLVNKTGYTAGDANVKFTTGTNNNNSYYDGSVVRFYAGSSMIITPLNGVTITRVEIVRSSSTSSNSGTISADNLTASNSNSTINTNVFTGSSTTAVTFTNSAQCRFTALNVTYTTSGGGSSTTYYHSTPDCGSTQPTYTLTLDSDLSCVTDGSATVELNATELTSFTPATRDGFTCSGYWSAPSGGVKVLNADGTFAATSVQEYITDGKWTNEGNVTLTPRWVCSNTMTLSVGTQSGGTYSLSKTSLETCDCEDDKRQVTITATPHSGYSVTDISYSGAGTATKVSGPTVNGNNTEWVYQFYQGDNGNGTFTVTFSTIPTYTITWMANGQEFHKQQDATHGTDLAVPSAPDPETYACDDKVFVGWTATPISGTTDDEPADLFTTKTAKVEEAATTYYAVFATADAGGSTTDTYDWESTSTGNWTVDAKITRTESQGVDESYAGKINTNDTYVTYNNKVAVTNFSFQFKRTSTNSNYNVYIETSTDKSNWSTAATYAMNSFGNGSYTSKSHTFDGTQDLYVRFYCYNTTATRYVDNVSITYGGTSYSDYVTTCAVIPDPVWGGAVINHNSIKVDCGSMTKLNAADPNGPATISFPAATNHTLTYDITVTASEGFRVSTNKTDAAKYGASVTVSPNKTGDNAGKITQNVYVVAVAPAMSDEDFMGTITLSGKQLAENQVIDVTADVTCTQYTLTLVDRGVSTEQPTKYYAGETIDEAPADPEGVCTDPIHYVFDGWAEATVAAGATTYTKVTFPYTVTGNTKFYAVYRYLDDGGEPSNDFIKVTKEKDDWTGDYVIVNEDAEKAIGNAYQNTNTLTAVDVTIQDNKVVSPSEAVIWQIRKNGENYTMYNVSANKYAYIAKADAKGAGLNATTTNTTQDIQIIFNNGTAKVSGVDIYRCFYYYGTNTEWRTYATGSYNTGALYCRSLESYLYTTSPVCGPHLVITEGKDIYVTGGNAGGTRDLVIAQQKVSYKATRLQTSNGLVDGTAPDVKVATNGITIGGVVTQDVKVTIDQTKEQQTDGTYTITGTITVQYQPSANNKQEDIQVQLAVDYNAEARDNFTVHARSLPAEFVIVAKSGDKWYALNGDMNTNAANPANGQVTLDDDANPTKATYAPCNTIYTFDGLPNTGDRTYVRFQGTDGAWLWASSGTNVGIQNNVLKTTPEGNNNAYNWKLYTQDNITYQFGNANSNRQLTLSDEKFGMYASGVQDIRILPYVEKCLYNYAPSNLKVSVLKGTSVTLTWDAVAGATKYQYSTNATNWTDCGTEPTATITGLTGDKEYTYYIRAYHEDAGVSQECIDYAEITFTTANCDDVPTDITYSADLNSITVSWTAAAPTATIKLYTNADGTGGSSIYPSAKSPYKISGGLKKNTTYYIQILADGTCASPIIPVKTKDVEVDIVEWQPQGIIVDINTDETVGVTLENEVSYGSGIGTEATELFFSKYYEASYNVKLVAIYNGTKNIIDLTDYTIQYGKTSWESNYITLKDFGATKGQIQPGEEIILYSYTEKDADDKKILDCVHDAYPDGNWVRVTSSNNEGKGTLSFGGDKTIILCKTEYDDEEDEYYDNIIDVIGALIEDPNEGFLPTNENTEKPSWGDKEGWVCEEGLSIADDSQIGISTNRCLLIRNNTVTSGDDAVTHNIDNFVTLCSEWKGAHVPDDAADNGVQASCDNFAYVGTFDYSDYYTKYEPMGEGTTFDDKNRNPDGTVTIPITDLYKHACSNIRVKLTNSNSEVLSDREYKVPIMITTTQGTDGQAFIDLRQNLATKEVDGEGKVIATHPLSLDEVREICKTCDVVVRDNAILTKADDDAANDHPEVRDVYVYHNSSLIVPAGTNYTINNLSLRRKQDTVASLNVHPEALKLPESAAAPISLDFRLSAESWHWFTLPYDCNISEVTWVDGSPAQYNVDWFLMTYDGEKRAATQAGGCWKAYTGTTIRAGEGFILAINGNINNPAHTYELRFPMSKEVLAAEGTDKTVDVRAWGVETDIRPNHKGWNLVGNPYLAYYQRNNITNFEGLRLGQLTGPDPQTGYWEQTGDVPYVVVPVGAGWIAYEQVLASATDLLPFTAYFVQVGNDGTHNSTQDLKVAFDHTKLQLSATPMPASIIQRSATEDEEPIIVGVSLTNAKGESDKTSLIIDDQYTDEYEMNADFFKWFGDYYKYYTKPVVYSLGADNGKRAFNALSEDLATQPISLGMYAAQAGNYTFTLDRRSDLSKVQEVWLYDATQDKYTNLMQDSYTFNTAKTESAGRFFLSVKMAPKVSTDINNVTDGTIWATIQDHTIFVNGLLSNAQLWIYDATGKLLHADHTTNYQHSYSVPTSGVYFVRVNGQAEAQTIKVVVE